MTIQDDLIVAVCEGNIASAEKLLAQGAQIGQDEILHGVARRGDVAMLDFLLKNGGLTYIDQFDSFSFTPLTWAAEQAHLPAMKLLIEAGANVNAVEEDRIGNTALREVVGDGNIEVIKLLLSEGADPLIPGWMQMTAIDKAESEWKNGKSTAGNEVLALLNAKKIEAAKILSKVAKPRSRKH